MARVQWTGERVNRSYNDLVAVVHMATEKIAELSSANVEW